MVRTYRPCRLLILKAQSPIHWPTSSRASGGSAVDSCTLLIVMAKECPSARSIVPLSESPSRVISTTLFQTVMIFTRELVAVTMARPPAPSPVIDQ